MLIVTFFNDDVVERDSLCDLLGLAFKWEARDTLDKVVV